MNNFKFELTNILDDFVHSNYITEWQAGYISGMSNFIESAHDDYDFSEDIDYEKIYKQLVMFVHSYLHTKEDING